MAIRFFSRFSSPGFDRSGSQAADLAIVNADVFTSDTAKPRARAVAVKDGRITYVGDDAGAADFIGADTEVIDARGRVLTPGFVDNHCHVLWIGGLRALMTTELFDADTLEEMASCMRRQAAEHPELPMVIGLGFHYEYLPLGGPDMALVDSIIPDRPAMIWSYSGQPICINTPAYRLMTEKNPEAFRQLVPEMDRRGGFTGNLQHAHAFNIFDFFSVEELSGDVKERFFENMADALEEALSVGVTTMQDAQLYREFIPMVLEFRERGGLDKVRLRGTYYVGHFVLEDEERFRRDLAWWKELNKESDPHLILGDCIKAYIDGVSSGHTSFMFKPFSDAPGQYGDANWSMEGWNRAMEIIDGMGLQACTHACGDAGIRRVINGYRHAAEINGKRDARHRADHCSGPLPEDLKTMAEHGIYAAMQPAHFFADETIEKALGWERLQGYMPWRSMEKAGVPICFGSDWCAGPINPVYGLLVAANRLNYRLKRDWGPQEKISLEDAVRHWTIDSAHALFMEDDIGSLEVGKYGDMILFNTSPFKLDSLWFLLTHRLELGAMDDYVDLTVVGGEVVYRRS